MKAQEGTAIDAGDVFATTDIAEWRGEEKTAHKPVSSGIRFHVPGAVVGKGRPRIGRAGAHARMFTPAKTVNYESWVKLCANQAMAGRDLYTEAVQVNLLIGVAVPMSWSKKKHQQALAGQLYPTSKPDLDNSIKSVFDAMNGVVYKDDAQVVTTVTKKRYREAPGLWVTVFAMGGETT